MGWKTCQLEAVAGKLLLASWPAACHWPCRYTTHHVYQKQESFSRKSVSEFQLKGAHCVQYMMAGATPDLHSMHITLYSTVDAASEMHCDVWRSQTSKGNKRMPEQFTFVI